MKVAVCIPSLGDITQPCLEALAASDPVLKAASHTPYLINERGNPYISAARATMLRKALDGGAEVVVFIDYDLSWRPEDLLKLIDTEGDVVAGTYRFKKDEEEYMGEWMRHPSGRPIRADDGTLKASRVPAGFLKVTRDAVDRFMREYPELVYGPRYSPSVDLFNHGVIEGVWYGEDYAFSKRWVEKCGDLWLVPDLSLTHHSADKAYPGNLHEFLMRQSGGINDPARKVAA